MQILKARTNITNWAEDAFASLRSVTSLLTNETMSALPEQVGVGLSQTHIVMEREAVQLHVPLRMMQRRVLEERDAVIGVGIHDWNWRTTTQSTPPFNQSQEPLINQLR